MTPIRTGRHEISSYEERLIDDSCMPAVILLSERFVARRLTMVPHAHAHAHGPKKKLPTEMGMLNNKS